jgi:lipopolysaccharide transport system ATP-binding protein
MSQPIIEVQNLAKRYQLGSIGATSIREEASRLWGRLRGVAHPDASEFWALRDVSFAVRPGEVIGVIGRNGAGKSTLLKILSRITEPTSGSARLRGRVASLLEVGTGFHPELSGRENVFLNGAILGMTKAEVRSKFDEIVAFAEVEQFIDTPVKRYSSGMYVRLAFAVAAHLEPEILIVDEVLAVGDAQFQKKCLGKMQDVSAREGRTVLFVSHNLASLQQLCSRLIYLQAGRVAGDGEPAPLIRSYLGSMGKQDPVLNLARAFRGLDPIGGARLETVRMEAPDPATPWLLPFDKSLRLTFALTVNKPLATLELGLGMFNAQGVEIVSTLSSWQETFGPVAPGSYELAVDYGVLELVPGSYRFGVGLKSHIGLEDYLPEAFEIEVSPSPRSPRAQLATVRGAIARSARFTLSPLPIT